MSIDQLPAFLTRDEFREYMGIGRTLAYKLLQRYGVRVGNLHRMPREKILEILAGLEVAAQNGTKSFPPAGCAGNIEQEAR